MTMGKATNCIGCMRWNLERHARTKCNERSTILTASDHRLPRKGVGKPTVFFDTPDVGKPARAPERGTAKVMTVARIEA
jgi:hypothetical protein